MTDATGIRCAACQAPLADGDRFCEECGARIGEREPGEGGCRACGATDSLDADGYCTVCGVREPGPTERMETDLGRLAAVSDRGRVHRRNEDACEIALAPGGEAVIVVCDGISTASAGDAAARTAALAAASALASGATEGSLPEVLARAVAAARAAVAPVAWTTRTERGFPSCTLVAALCREDELAVASVGDSRAYWIDPGGARQLTVDESWAQEQVDAGRLSVEAAFADRRAHSITNWIGVDAPDRPPAVVVLRPERPGRLLLCSDGLWNYLAGPEQLAEMIGALPPGASPAAVARALTAAAVQRGGRDNITVAVVDIPRP